MGGCTYIYSWKTEACFIKYNVRSNHFHCNAPSNRERGRKTDTERLVFQCFFTALIITLRWIFNEAKALWVRPWEWGQNGSLECEVVNIAIECLMMGSCSLFPGPYCLHSDMMCGFSHPACTATVNNPPVERERKRETALRSAREWPYHIALSAPLFIGNNDIFTLLSSAGWIPNLAASHTHLSPQ